MDLIITLLKQALGSGTLTTASMVLVNLCLLLYIITKFLKNTLSGIEKLITIVNNIQNELTRNMDNIQTDIRKIDNSLISVEKDISNIMFDSRMSALLIEKKEIK